MIARDNAELAGHAFYKGLYVGGCLKDGTSQESATVGAASYVQCVTGTTLFNFNGGVTYGQGTGPCADDWEVRARELGTEP